MRALSILALLCSLLTGCDDIVGVEDISEESVTVLAPQNNSVIHTSSVGFNWEPVNEASGYRLQIAQPSFENASQILTDSLVTGTFFNKSLESGDYEWRVRAENSAYHSFYTTQQFSVEAEIVDISGQNVNLLAPADNATFSTTDTINFYWEAVSNADEYVFQMASPNFQNADSIEEDHVLSTTDFSVTNLDVGEYEWRVKARNTDYETLYTTNSLTVEE